MSAAQQRDTTTKIDMNIDEALIAADEFLPLLKWQQNGGVIPIALYVLATEVRRQRDEIGKLRSALALYRIGKNNG